MQHYAKTPVVSTQYASSFLWLRTKAKNEKYAIFLPNR